MNGNPSSQVQSSSNKTLLWILLAVVVLAVLSFAYYAYYRSMPQPDTTGGAISVDDTSSLAEELNAIEVEGLDSELGDIEKELGAQ